MKEKTLDEYLREAKYYLYHVNADTEERFRTKTISFCKEHGLDEKFLTLVKENEKWRELAAQMDVQFFVDVPHVKDFFSKQDDSIIGIGIMIFEPKNPIPVIKITSPRNIF